ncbi:magnesium transporter [Candidatus Woesearchaeota archaeon]|nr:magnesium transporter [Candidatus Woesearchaeota archaeon]
MKNLRRHLARIRGLKREQHHKLIHHVHKKYKISKKTLFYVKEYGPHSNVAKTIIRESVKILLFASIISSLGGLGLESIKTRFIALLPLVILLPTLNDMVGDYGSIISSRFSVMLYENKIKKNLYKNQELRHLFAQIFIIAMLTTVISLVFALIISAFSNYNLDAKLIAKIFLISLIDVILLILILFFVSVFAGVYFYKKQEDPNNFLIPITTSVADFGNMIILSGLVLLFF